MKKGEIDVIVGPMFSGKTTKFLDSLERAELAKKKVIVFKPENDDRYGLETVTDRNKRFKFKANLLPIKATNEQYNQLLKITQEYDVVGIDEVQFLQEWVVSFLQELRNKGKKVIVCGLDTDYMAQPFGQIGNLMAISNKINKLEAVCMQCGEDANYTQRMLDGKPAPIGETVAIGDKGENRNNSYTYEARCQSCYVHPSKVSELKAI